MWLGSRRVGQIVFALVAAGGFMLATLLPAPPVAAQSRPELGRPGQDPVEIVEGEILVKFKPGATGQAIADAHR